MNLLSKISQRDKRILIIGGIIVLLILLYRAFIWSNDIRTAMQNHTDAKKITLERQIKKISLKESLLNTHSLLSAETEQLESGLIPTEKPPVAAARIQRTLKEMASSLDIEIIREKALNPVDAGLYLAIPVEIGFRTTSEKLKSMLFRIKTSDFLLTTSDVKIRVSNIRNPVDAHTTMIVTGFIKKLTETSDEDGKEE